MDVDKKFTKAIETRNSGDLELAAKMFVSLIEKYPDEPQLSGIYTVLGGIYDDLRKTSEALNCFEEATRLSPSSELSSLGLYLMYTNLERYPEAIQELERFLSKYPANRYKVTLRELLSDLEVGYAVSYKSTILELANKHEVSLH